MVRKTVMIDEQLIRQLELVARKEDRDFSGSLRRALRIGLLAMQNPELTAGEIADVLDARVEYEAGMSREVGLEAF